MWTKRCDPVLHIELRRWADLFVIAPLDANTLGKIASGICDNLLVSNICVIVSLLQVELYDVCDFVWVLHWVCYYVCCFNLTDVRGEGLGHKPSSALLSCYEHSHVEPPYHCTASGHT